MYYVCGGKSYVETEDSGIEREAWLREFMELPNGIPDSDTFRRLFEAVNPQELSKNLVSKIVDGKADYTISLKENQPKLHKKVIKHFEKTDFTQLQFAEAFDNGHERSEHREYYLETDLKWLDKVDEWCGLKSIGMAKSEKT